jgi:hypothetical protein
MKALLHAASRLGTVRPRKAPSKESTVQGKHHASGGIRLGEYVCGVEGVEECRGLIPSAAQHMEGSHAALVAAHHFAVDQDRPNLEVVHCLHHKGKA